MPYDVLAFGRIGFVEGRQNADRAVVYLVDRDECGAASRGGLGVAGGHPLLVRTDCGAHRPCGVADGRERGPDAVGQRLPSARRQIVEDRGPVLGGAFELVDGLLFDQFGAAPRRSCDGGSRKLLRGNSGHSIDQFVSFVDDNDVVLGQDLDSGDRVDCEQGMVGHHDVDLCGLGAGALGEAILADGAPRLAQAFAGRDADLTPGLIAHAGHHVVAVTGLGLGRPLRQSHHLASHPRHGERIEQFRVRRFLRCAGMNLVHAQVVVAALEDRELRPTAEGLGQRIGQAWQIAVDQLPLQRDGGCGDDDGLPRFDRVPNARHEVGERLAGARACLHSEVLAGIDRMRHRRGHRQLIATFLAAERVHRNLQERGNGR